MASWVEPALVALGLTLGVVAFLTLVLGSALLKAAELSQDGAGVATEEAPKTEQATAPERSE